MERRDMQPLVRDLLANWVANMDFPKDMDHRRRLVRVLLRQAARMVINAGAGVNAFMTLCLECILQEVKEVKYPTADIFPSPPSNSKDIN